MVESKHRQMRPISDGNWTDKMTLAVYFQILGSRAYVNHCVSDVILLPIAINGLR